MASPARHWNEYSMHSPTTNLDFVVRFPDWPNVHDGIEYFISGTTQSIGLDLFVYGVFLHNSAFLIQSRVQALELALLLSLHEAQNKMGEILIL